MTIVAAAYAIYGMNILLWRNGADFGWRWMEEAGPNVVCEVTDVGREGGLRVGDRILAVNGKPYVSYEELLRFRHAEAGAVNSYEVSRDGKVLQLNVTSGKLGIRAFLLSGPDYLTGLIYVFIGVVVFLMKPTAAESRLFLAMTCFLGVTISFTGRCQVLKPIWFYAVIRFAEVFLPATIIHLALKFPKPRTFIVGRPRLLAAPYIISLVLFVLYETNNTATITYYADQPYLDLIKVCYWAFSVLVFLASALWNFLKEGASHAVRLQSQVIFIGILLGFLIPMIDLLLRSTMQTYLFPDPTIGFSIFLMIFPISIAYSIVKHDLFAIDVIVRRTYGYILSTAAVIGVYMLLVLTLNVIFQSSNVSKSPLFSILFALGVVFFFRPIHERFQKFVDRVFYRQHYDYRKTIKDLSEAIISILDAEQIRKALIGSVVREMFLENGMLLIAEPAGRSFSVQIIEGEANSNPHFSDLPEDDELPALLREKKDALFSYEADLNPAYESFRETLKETFHRFKSEVMLPMLYKDKMQGIISLGRKKSGKMFTREDMDLLKTIANQSAVALENARLFKENLDKCRMEEELAIARDLQMSMLPAACPQIEGYRIAASSVPAREVGGDFFDFIEMGDQRLGFLIGDVTGKSVSGALVMAASRSVFRMLSEQEASVGDIMMHANRRIKKDIKSGMFVALLFVVIESKGTALCLSSAGQTQPIHVSAASGHAQLIETVGDTFPLGILDDADYQETRVQLNHGDRVVFYTDGIVEAMNEHQEIFGFERLLELTANAGSLPAEILLQEIIQSVNAFAGNAPQHDDLTVIVLSVDQ